MVDLDAAVLAAEHDVIEAVVCRVKAGVHLRDGGTPAAVGGGEGRAVVARARIEEQLEEVAVGEAGPDLLARGVLVEDVVRQDHIRECSRDGLKRHLLQPRGVSPPCLPAGLSRPQRLDQRRKPCGQGAGRCRCCYMGRQPGWAVQVIASDHRRLVSAREGNHLGDPVVVEDLDGAVMAADERPPRLNTQQRRHCCRGDVFRRCVRASLGRLVKDRDRRRCEGEEAGSSNSERNDVFCQRRGEAEELRALDVKPFYLRAHEVVCGPV